MSRIFGAAVHAGFVVPDIDAAIARMLQSGAGPAFVIRRVSTPTRYRGVPHDLLMTAAFINSGPMQYEFVEQHDDTPSAYRDFTQKHPEGGLHHLAYLCNSFEEAFGQAARMGTSLSAVQEFIGPDGVPYEVYAEVDGASDPLLIQLTKRGPIAAMFSRIERIAVQWDGTDPIRNALDLLSPELHPPQVGG